MTAQPTNISASDRAKYFELFRLAQMPRKYLASIVVLQIACTGVEGVGFGTMLPILHILSSGRSDLPPEATGNILSAVSSAFNWIGLPMTLETLLVSAVVLLLFRQFFLMLRTVVQSMVFEEAKRNLRNLLFSRYMKVDLSYQDRESSGNLINAIIVETQNVTHTFLSAVMVVNVIIIGIFYITIMLFTSVSMTLVSVFTLALTMLMLHVVLEKSRRTGNELADANREISEFLIGRLQSLRLVRLTGNERNEIRRIYGITGELYRINVRLNYLGAALGVALEPIVITAALAILYAGVKFLGLSFAEIGFFVVILLRLLPVARDMVGFQQQFMSGFGTLAALHNRLDEMDEARENRSGTRLVPKIKKGIVLDHVHFEYSQTSARGSHAALHDISIVIPAGKMTAFVGPSGAGKSTLIDLFPRLRIPTQGKIFLDDIPLDAIDTEALRNSIAYVPQLPRIIEQSAGAHIRYGSSDLADAEVEEAARIAGAHDFIARLPNGYDTMLGEEGRLLSGGERQRLDLARALATHAPFLILDEPTSNLDAESEFKLQEALERLRRRGDITIMVIAHRLVTIAHADLIVVMRNGRIEARGTHDELLSASSWYAEAFGRQTSSLAKELAETAIHDTQD